jgi:hypothetical protein
MKKLIKTLIYSVFWRLFFENLNKLDFIQILNNISTYIRTLNFKEQLKLMRSFFSVPNNEINAYTFLSHPVDLRLSIFMDTLSKKLFFLTFIFSTVAFS